MQAEPRFGEASVQEIIAALTQDEKVKLLRGIGMHIPGLDAQQAGPVVGQLVEHRVPGAGGSTHQVARLGIPAIVLADGPAGLRISPTRTGTEQRFHATAFPVASLLAASWDIELVERVGRAMGQEVKEYGVDLLLAPALNLHRHPLGGRNFEYFSEDPLLSGKMAAALVRGVQSEGVGACVKHYVANNHEWNRFAIDVRVAVRALREIYLRGFEIAVKEGKPWTLMSSYNKVNGTYTSESPLLLTQILREEWGFQGLVMTDWFAGRDPVAQVRAGNDLLMPGLDVQEAAIKAALASGELHEALVDRNLANLLRLIARTPTFAGYAYSDTPELRANAEVARDAAAQGMVLLKNSQGVLPLAHHGQVAVFGNHAYALITGGTGSGDVAEAYSVPLPDGLEAAGIGVDADLAQTYRAHIAAELDKRPEPQGFTVFLPSAPLPELEFEKDAIARIAQENHSAILVLGRLSGEFLDREAADDFFLTGSEERLIGQLSQAFRALGKPFILVLNVGGVIETASWREQVDAMLLAWQPGQEAGNAIADLLSGRVNPSGKLIDTFPIGLEDAPAAENFPGVVTGEGSVVAGFIPFTPSEIEYRDGIWVGYRHFNSRRMAVAFEFGFGLSYTEFAYGDLVLSSAEFGQALEISVTIRNRGEVAGREVVQLYLEAPPGGLEKPSEELRAFAKTEQLQPGGAQTLRFTLTSRELASFDPERNAWVAAAGDYEVKIGASSRDIRCSARFCKATETLLAP